MANLVSNVKAIIAQQFEMPLNEDVMNANLQNYFIADDLRKSQVVAALRERFDIYITDEDTDQFNTTQDVIDYVETKLWWYSL